MAVVGKQIGLIPDYHAIKYDPIDFHLRGVERLRNGLSYEVGGRQVISAQVHSPDDPSICNAVSDVAVSTPRLDNTHSLEGNAPSQSNHPPQ